MKLSKPKGKLALQTVVMPADTNANGDIFGGWMVSHMDLAAGVEGRRRARCRVVTLAIDSLLFIKPIYVGDLVSCYTHISKVGRTSMHINVEVWTIALNEEKPKKVAQGLFIFVAIDEHGKPQAVDR